MSTLEVKQKIDSIREGHPGQRGSAIIIVLFVLALVSVFVALALSRNASEAAAVGNETSESRALYAAQGSLEMMTRNFNKVFERRLNPSGTDLDAVVNGTVPGLNAQYTFVQERPLQTTLTESVVLSEGPYSGLFASRDNWRLRTTATDNSTGTQVELTRNVLNNRIPIFQFGIFYNDDLELFRPPRFSFGGRVHSNGNFFVSPGAEGVYFDSRVTAADQIVTQTWRNWNQSDSANNQTWIRNASGTFVQLLPGRGSVLNTTPGAANNIFEFPPAVPAPQSTPNPDLPPSRLNPNWITQSAIFDGNLQSQVPALNLPLNVGANTDLIEMIKRGKEVASAAGGDLFHNNAGVLSPVTAASTDNDILRSERFANKTGIRISLADSKAKLPGCASGVGTGAIPGLCGVRLDGHFDGRGFNPPAPLPLPLPSPIPANIGDYARGYQPVPMKRTTADTGFGYRPTRVNGERLHTGGGREVWIKVETVRTDASTGAIVTQDITADILSLGITEQAPDLGSDFNITSIDPVTGVQYDETAPGSSLTATTAQAPSQGTDSRSIIKLQRFVIPGPAIPFSPTSLLTNFSSGGNSFNTVIRYNNVDSEDEIRLNCIGGVCNTANADPNSSLEHLAHVKRATIVGAGNDALKTTVPFPIEMFDTREGTYFDNAARYTAGRVTRNGVMSLVDIDIANLRRFLRGDFNGLFPTTTPYATDVKGGVGLVNTDIPQLGGWVLYVSDRRGDGNFDGEYDMEDIYGNDPGNDGILQLGEDLDGPTTGAPGFVPRFGAGVLDARYILQDLSGCQGGLPNCEAAEYEDEWFPDRAAVTDHPYFRRGVRLINGTTVPGNYDSATPANTRGFTVASENGVYVRGNYNATGAAAPPALGNTPFNQYFPFNTPTHIPASIVADSVTILSNNWNDAQSFSSPYNRANRPATNTQMRFAMISGDSISTRQNAVNQGSSVNGENENGGVHNFKRFLEIWTGDRLDYAGSLINLYNSRNNNGSFKCCETVYNPPVRNWVFDSTFLDPTRLPPGTPFFQYVQTTGFQRTNN